MDNKKVCHNCGENNDIESKFCKKCGLEYSKDDIDINNQVSIPNSENINSVNNNQTNISNEEEGNKLAVISLILYFCCSTVMVFISAILPESLRNSFSALSGLCPLAGIVVMIIGRVNYPNNKFLKIVMWIIIGCIALGMLIFIIFTIWCYITCSSMDFSGCS